MLFCDAQTVRRIPSLGDLRELHIGVDHLRSLDLSKLKSLRRLNVVGNLRTTDAFPIDELPDLEELGFVPARSALNAAVSRLLRCENLRRLSLRASKFDDASLHRLSALESLSHLDLYYTPVTSTGIASAPGFSGLKSLTIGEEQIDRTVSPALRKREIEALELFGVAQPEIARDIVDVASLRKLSFDWVGSSPLPKPASAGIANLQHLEDLQIRGAVGTDDLEAILKAHSGLKRLSLSLGFQPAPYAAIRHCTELRELEVLAISPETIQHIATLQHLEVLRLSPDPQNPDALAPLKSLRSLREFGFLASISPPPPSLLRWFPKLESVSLMGGNLDDSIFEMVDGHDSLLRIDVRVNRISADAVRQFEKKHPRTMVHWTRLSTEAWAAVQELQAEGITYDPNYRSLTVTGQGGLSERSARKIGALLTPLRSISLYGGALSQAQPILGDNLESLIVQRATIDDASKLPANLRSLRLDSQDVAIANVSFLERLTELRMLHLSGFSSLDGLEKLRSPNLDALWITGEALPSSAALVAVANASPRLSYLSLNVGELDEAVSNAFAKLKSLTRIDLSQFRGSAERQSALQKQLRGVELSIGPPGLSADQLRLWNKVAQSGGRLDDRSRLVFEGAMINSEIVEACRAVQPRVVGLVLDRCTIGEKDLESLLRMLPAQTIRIRKTALSDDAFASAVRDEAYQIELVGIAISSGWVKALRKAKGLSLMLYNCEIPDAVRKELKKHEDSSRIFVMISDEEPKR